MKRILPCAKDTYITNRIIRNTFRATDANVGGAGTLDLFKLAGESLIGANSGPFVSGTNDPIELTRLLLKFDFDPLRALTGSILDLNDPSFRCELQLFDVLGGQTLPSNYRLILYPLSKSFDEGVGRDVISYEDVNAANFITASVSGDSVVTWSQSGANGLGFVGQENIDVVTGSSVLGDVFVTQLFKEGDENLLMDITNIVSSTLAGDLPDLGFRLSFSGTHETNSRTLFVKRFASRHGPNTRIHPKIISSWDDSTRDNHENFIFDVTGSLFLRNFHRGEPSNIITPSGEITGSNSLLLTLTSGSVSGTLTKVVTASQYQVGGNFVPGVYFAEFAISSNETLLTSSINNDFSATFAESWTSLDGQTPLFNRTLVINRVLRQTAQLTSTPLKVNITNLKSVYKSTERIKFRVFAQDDSFAFKSSRLPIISPSKVFDKMYWQLRDALDDAVIFPFDTITNSTRMSTDDDGMYFEVFMSDLDIGRIYSFDILINEGGNERVLRNVGGIFRVEL